MIKTWFPWLVALVLVVAVFTGPQSRAAEGDVPIAEFAGEGGVCTLPERDVDRIQKIIYFLVEKIRELQAKTGCS